MAWATENERISALSFGLGGDLLGFAPWAASGFQDQDMSVLFGTGLDVDDVGSGSPTSPEEVNRLDYISPFGLRVRRPGAWG